MAIVGDKGVSRAERTLLNRCDKLGCPVVAIGTDTSQFLVVVGFFNFLTFTITLQMITKWLVSFTKERKEYVGRVKKKQAVRFD